MSFVPPPNRGPGLRLHLNENTGGCSPAVLAALRGMSGEDIASYPDYDTVTATCERWFGVRAGWVQLTNGLDEGLILVAQRAAAMSAAGGSAPSGAVGFEAVAVEPVFDYYPDCTEAAGGRLVRVAPGPDFTFPLEAVLGRISSATRLVYLTDPNNPTGLAVPVGALEAVATAAPHALVLMDEAYADFSGRTAIGPALDRFRNVVVGRTFAKAHGLAGLRVGALVAHPDTLAPIRRLQQPYAVNACAVRALGAALQDRAYVDAYVEQSVRSRELIYGFCERHGFQYWRSDGNFVLVDVGDAVAQVVEALAERGVFVRDRSDQVACAGCFRVAAGLTEHTNRFFSALEDVLASRHD